MSTQLDRTDLANLADLVRQAGDIVEPPPNRTADEWADACRILPEGSPEPGPWRTDRVPYTRDIYRAFSDPRYTTIVGVMGAQMSKALALDTPIPTPTGWTCMGNLAVGDEIFDESGRPCRVTHKSEVFHDHVCYRVEFCDGESIVADAGHRWAVYDRKGKRRIWTTQQIAEKTHGSVAAARVDVTHPLACAPADLPIDPYVLGVWLGDGNTQSAQVTCDRRDGVIAQLEAVLGPLDVAETRVPHVVTVKLGAATNVGQRADVCGRGHQKRDYNGKRQCPECARLHAWYKRRGMRAPAPPKLRSNGMHAALADLGVIGHKHIPLQYLRASEAQRWALLQGLMDTDGHAEKNGHLGFTTKSRQLAEDVRELLSSLGIKSVLKCRSGKIAGRVVGEYWQVRATAYADQPVFRLARKQSRLKRRDDPTARATEGARRSIRAVVPVPSVPVRCIAVDSPSHLFLAGRTMIPTHNTELLLNVLGHRFTDGPYVPALYIGPTEKQVRSMSNDRVMKMLRSTPVLWDRMAKGQRNKVAEKWIAGIRLGFAWAGSATELASHPAGLVLVDERDRMDNDVAGEGDPVTLAKARGSNYWDFKLGIFSTPTIEGASPIWSLFEEGTMFKWAWPCLHCGEFFVPRLELLTYADSEDYRELQESAVVACPHCGGTHESKHKRRLNEGGGYIPHVMGPNGQHEAVAEPAPNSTASFWVSGLCSPWQTFGQRAEQLAKAYRSREPERIQGTINTAFGELFKVRGEAPPWEQVLETRTQNPRHFVPDWCQLVTMGVDVQKRGLYYVIRGWGFNSRSHLIDHDYIHGETEYDDVWVTFGQVLTKLKADGKRLVHVAFIDSGYKPGHDRFRRPEHKVYEVCRRMQGFAFPAKGHDTLERPIRASQIDVTISGRVIKGGVTLWHVDTDHVKSWIHAQIALPEGTERQWTTHSQIDEDYCRQIVAEELVVKPSGRRVWVIPNHRANHYFDCEVLARAAAMSRQVHALPQLRTEIHVAEPPKPKPAFVQPTPRPGGWFKR